MTRTTRRLLYALAFAIFFLFGPPLVLLTAGWRWEGWGRGLSRSAVIVISSSPTAQFRVNDRFIGTTPEQVRSLRPGSYRLSLERPGYASWSQTIRVEGGLATIIGPVQLVRADPVVSQAERLQTPGAWVTDSQQRALAWVQPQLTGATMQLIRPKESAVWTLPFSPDNIVVAPGGETLIAQNAERQVVIDVDSGELWETDLADRFDWSDFSANIFLGQRGTEIIVYDTLEKTSTLIAHGSSAAFAFGNIWLTQPVGEQTSIERLAYPSQGKFVSVFSRAGKWQFLNSPEGTLWLQSSTQSEFWTTSPQFSQRGGRVGPTEKLYWGTRSDPPIWQAGVSVYALDTRKNSWLIERSPDAFTWLAWQVPKHVVAALTPEALQLRSISSQQGRHVLASYALPDDAAVLLQLPQRRAWVGLTDGTLEAWSWK